MPRAIISGVGLVGASVGLGLRSSGWTVVGTDPRPERLDEALRRGAIDSAADPDAISGESDLVVLAGPPDSVVSQLVSLETASLVSDVAGVKAPIVSAARAVPRFVGGHPMAGGTTSGPDLASGRLFHGATWVLTSDGASENDLSEMASIVRSLGANPTVMTAEEHDRAVALVSHLPHILAVALVNAVREHPEALRLAGGGFRDLTRIASSTGSWWSEVLTSNEDQVRTAVDLLQHEIGELTRSLEDPSHLDRLLSTARTSRDGMVEQQARVGVILIDEPGEIARVGRALETSKVDVRDFQLRHGEHGGGGVLTITVTPSGEGRLRSALEGQGFTLQ